jgi:hypothetical protein
MQVYDCAGGNALKFFRMLALLCVVILLAACRDRGKTPEDLPTRVPPADVLATSQVLTENAPPPGFRDTVSFPQIDDNLPELTNWRYESLMNFDGVFSRTPREVDAETRVNVWYNRQGRQRRVVVEGEGELFGQAEPTELEGVRLGEDTFLVRDNACLGDAGGQAATVADLRAGDQIGGVANAVPAGAKATINGEEVWQYTFTVEI